MKAIPYAAIAALLLGAVVCVPPAPAQIGGMVRGAVNSQIQKKIDDAVSCAFDDQACIDKAHKNGKKVTVTDKNGKPLKDQSAANNTATDSTVPSATTGDPPGKGVWLNYDFIPGDRVLFYDDFSSDNVGDLPTHEDVSSGNVTVVDIKGHKYLHTVTGAEMTITLAEPLPQRFTIEAVYHRRGGNGMGLFFRVGSETSELTFRCDQGNATVSGVGPNGSKESGQDVAGIGEDDLETCRLMVDGGYAKAYLNSVRVGQLNGLQFERGKTIRVEMPNADENGSLLTDIRVAAGGKLMYDALTADGHVATQGIYFDTGSDRIRGESTPTLKQIGDMLQQHAELSITIQGHTDNTGTAAGNQSLSERRAAAVRQYLIDNYKVDGARLKSAGFGSTKPVSTNDTAEGRQNNRRVELVKN